MVVQRCIQERLAQMGLQSVAHLIDMTNAFASTTAARRDQTVEQRIAPRSGPRMGYPDYFTQNVGASAVQFTADTGETLDVWPGAGNIVGSSEGPLFFSWAFNGSMREWFQLRKDAAPSPTGAEASAWFCT